MDRFPKSWKTMGLDRKLFAIRSPLLCGMVVGLFCLTFVLLWFMISFFVGVFHILFSSHAEMFPAPQPDAITHFAGSRECGILQSDLYLPPHPSDLNVSPFCRNRAALLEALSSGGRYDFDEPYAGKGCTYRWFSTAEICMILERFSAVIFIGDSVVQSIYAAFNILLCEDLELGGVQSWLMDNHDRAQCSCENQFIDSHCQNYMINSSDELETRPREQDAILWYCQRIPHAHIPLNSTPAPISAQSLFKDFTYLKPNPWQPSPVIFSLSQGFSFDVTIITESLDEWLTLVAGSERNVPVLFLGPEATMQAGGKMNKMWDFEEQIAGITKQRYIDFLGLYNLTLQASTVAEKQFGEKVRLVEAMMVINWLSKLE